jgi:hypothetical protein
MLLIWRSSADGASSRRAAELKEAMRESRRKEEARLGGGATASASAAAAGGSQDSWEDSGLPKDGRVALVAPSGAPPLRPGPGSAPLSFCPGSMLGGALVRRFLVGSERSLLAVPRLLLRRRGVMDACRS